MNRRRILLISSNYFPEETGIAVYSSDLAQNILVPNFETTTITGLPHYPWWKIPEKFAHLTAGRMYIEGLDLIRINHAVPSDSGVIGRAKLEYSFWVNGKKVLKKIELRKFDLVIAIMPTVAAGLLAKRISKKLSIPGIIIFQDITSLGALQSGMPGAPFLHKIAKFLETRAARWASKIVVVSEQMAKVITELTNDSVPLEVIHNYSTVKISSLDYSQARKYFEIPENQYLIIHTGNIGYKQDLLNVVQTAKLLVSEPDIKFIIYGHGNQEEVIREAVTGVSNIELRPFVSSEDYPKILASADVLLVNERPSLREMSLPSKLTSYLTSGRPVVAAVSEQSATSKFLKEAALFVEPGNPQALAEIIMRLKADVSLQEELGKRGKEFSEKNLSPESGRAKYLKLIKGLLPTTQL